MEGRPLEGGELEGCLDAAHSEEQLEKPREALKPLTLLFRKAGGRV